MFGVEAAASLVLSMLGFIFICFNTVCLHALFFLWFPINQSSVTSTAGFTWLQSPKHVLTSNWLWFVVIGFCGCINCSLCFLGTLVLSCVSTLPNCILFCNQKVQFTRKVTTCICYKQRKSTFRLLLKTAFTTETSHYRGTCPESSHCGVNTNLVAFNNNGIFTAKYHHHKTLPSIFQPNTLQPGSPGRYCMCALPDTLNDSTSWRAFLYFAKDVVTDIMLSLSSINVSASYI